MIRYSTIDNKLKREIVLLKAKPCRWGKCKFCDYIEDNETDEKIIEDINKKALSHVTGKYGVLEVIDSASVFELTETTLKSIKKIVDEKNIHLLLFEAHWIYRNRLNEIRNYFDRKIIFKTGIETFDNNFRMNVLNKGADFKNYLEVKKYFDSCCIMVGIRGQNMEMIDRDIEILNHFKHGTVNVFNDNSTSIKRDNKLVKDFMKKYAQKLIKNPKIDFLYNITDFGVGI